MSVEYHDLAIDRYGDDGQHVIASCSCGWLDDECYSPSDAAERFESHCEQMFEDATEVEQ